MEKRTIINVWHGFGTFTGLVSHDGHGGNAASSFVELDFGESALSGLNAESDAHGRVQKLSLWLNGSCERSGLSMLLEKVSEALARPAEQLGDVINLGYEDGLDEEPPLSLEEKGLIGEEALNDWLQSIGISYLYINQSPETFARLFKGALKRPDFLVLLESIGMIAVDAKNYKLFNGGYSLPLRSELQRVLAFERLFRIPVWYAYRGEGSHENHVWYWISALKAVEVGKVKHNSITDEDFLFVKLEDFVRIERNEDLGKLYTQRLPSLNGKLP